jgi:hypothetical protein
MHTITPRLVQDLRLFSFGSNHWGPRDITFPCQHSHAQMMAAAP